jgi:hypothetical protein
MTPTPNQVVRHDIAFLHTSAVHVPTFDKLMQELAPALRVTHSVCEALLAQAQHDGADSPTLIAAVCQAMTQACASGATVVVCTCSTIGGIAETMETNGAFTATRVDRAMADLAVSKGLPIQLVAALESTLVPTTDLLQTSARRMGVTLDIESLVVREAWPYFTAGDHDRYIDTLVQAVSERSSAGKVVVLAQASMAPAVDALAKLGITALSSPRLGVEHAVALHAKLRTTD